MHAITHPHASAQTRVFQIAIRSGGGGWGVGGGVNPNPPTGEKESGILLGNFFNWVKRN